MRDAAFVRGVALRQKRRETESDLEGVFDGFLAGQPTRGTQLERKVGVIQSVGSLLVEELMGSVLESLKQISSLLQLIVDPS